MSRKEEMPGGGGDGRKEKMPWRFMAPLLLGTIMNPLNSSMLATALVTLCNAFKVTPGQGATLVTVLYMTCTIAQPLMGRLADIYSARKVNNLGLLLVLVAALTGIFAPAFEWLIVSRILLGFGTSAFYPSAVALMSKRWGAEGKPIPGPALGLIAVTGQVSMVVGPTLGGFLTQYLGWRGIFMINIPFVIVAMFLSRAIPDYPAASNTQGRSLSARLDIPGIVLFGVFLLALLSMLTGEGVNVYRILGVIVSLVAVCAWEWRQESPFIDVRLLARRRSLSLVYVRAMATSYVLYLMLYGLPQWLEGVKHEIPVHTGLIMMPNTLVAITMGLLVARIRQSKWQNVLGVFLLMAAWCGIFLLHADIPLPFVICIGIIAGASEGSNLIANQSLLNEQAPAEQKGVSFGLYRTFAYIGAILSGTQLKASFRNGVTDESFHQISYYIAISCIVLLILLFPLMFPKRAKDAAVGGKPLEGGRERRQASV